MMLTIYRVLKVDWQGREWLGKAFLDEDKAHFYAHEWRKLNKIEHIVVKAETAHQ